MKRLLLIMSIFVVSIGWGQSTERYVTPMELPTNIERYNVDYKLVDESVIVSDSSILSQIDLDRLDSMRAIDHNVVVNDVNTGLEIILFYKKKSARINSLNTFEQ